MKPLILKSVPAVLETMLVTGLFMLTPSPKAYATPVDTLLGTWRGSGTVRLNTGTERLTCNAYYTGGGSRLGMAIRCNSPSGKVEIRSKLSLSGNRLSGNWEERTYNASGSASGTANPGRINIRVSGTIKGSMVVSYSKSRQSVSISLAGSPLQAVKVNLSRSG